MLFLEKKSNSDQQQNLLADAVMSMIKKGKDPPICCSSPPCLVSLREYIEDLCSALHFHNVNIR